MTTFQIVAIIGIFILLAVGYWLLERGFRAERELNDRRYSASSKAFANLAAKLAEMNERVNECCAENQKLRERLKTLDKQFSELPLEELDEEVKRMASWNDGWSEIVNFGKDIPKLNKEGLKHE